MAGAAPAAREVSLPEAVGKGLVALPTGALSLEQLKAVFATLRPWTSPSWTRKTACVSSARARTASSPGRRRSSDGWCRTAIRPRASTSWTASAPTSASGRQDVAEFRIDFKGRFVQVRYFALRNDKRAYLGALEVTQDLTRERTLQGERRLLQHES